MHHHHHEVHSMVERAPSTHLQSVSLSVEAAKRSNNNKTTKLSQIVLSQETQNPIEIQWAVSWEGRNCYSSVDVGVVVGKPTVQEKNVSEPLVASR
jgi:hypothetical protein